MDVTRPLLIFSKPETVETPKRPSRALPPPRPKDSEQREERINESFQNAINYIQAAPGGSAHVLVIETAGRFQDFHKAVDKIDGLEWLAEFDVEDVNLDDMYDLDSSDYEQVKKLGGRCYLSSSNAQALTNLLKIYNDWEKTGKIKRGFGGWKNFFTYISDLRLWNEKDRLENTGILQRWKEDVKAKSGTASECNFEIELHYRNDRDNSEEVIDQIKQLKGKVSKVYRNQEIAFHAIKASLPVAAVAAVLDANQGNSNYPSWIQLNEIKYCLPIGQQLQEDIKPENTELFTIKNHKIKTDPPIVALFDGVPLANHELIKDFIVLDDPDEFINKYEADQHKHGTAMASLICHNDLSNPDRKTIERKIYVRPIMYPNFAPPPVEQIPDTVFIEDLIERSIVRLMDGEGTFEPTCPSIKIINLSIGNIDRPFMREISSWARLIDWLSWKYKILFIISAGNFKSDSIHVPDKDDVVGGFISEIQNTRINRRLLSPAESMNSLTVGAIQHDYSLPKVKGLDDPYKEKRLPAEYSRNGPGFRHQIKPDILLPGGRKLYKIQDKKWIPWDQRVIGQKTASGASAEKITYTTHTHGTSNATAIATHAAAHLYEVIVALEQDGDPIPVAYHALVIKSLLVHGASWGDMKDTYSLLRNEQNSRKIKRLYANHLGYGEADFERVRSCTERRVTMIGFGQLSQKKRHRFLLPMAKTFNRLHLRLIVTLAWFTPINPFRYGYRAAKLSFEIKVSDNNVPQKADRQEADWQQVEKGTLQHEIFDLGRFSGSKIEVFVRCAADAVDYLDDSIPYAIAFTVEAAQETQLDLYDMIKQSIRTPGIYP